MAQKNRYPEALIFDAWWIPPDRFDPIEDEPDAVRLAMDALEATDPEMRSNRRRSRAYGTSMLIGPWD